MSVGARLATAVQASGDTLRAFAARADVPYRTIQNYLGGQRAPHSDVLAQICTRTGICCHWLLTGEGQMYRSRADRVICDGTREDPGAWSSGVGATDGAGDGAAPEGQTPIEQIAAQLARYTCATDDDTPRLAGIIGWLLTWWAQATAEDRIWLDQQLQRSIPEYADHIRAALGRPASVSDAPPGSTADR